MKLTLTSTTEKAVSLASQLCKLLEKGSFRLTKRYSNDREVLATIPESGRAKSVVNLEFELLPTESARGLKWNTEEDKFVWEVLDKILHLVPFFSLGHPFNFSLNLVPTR